MSFSGIQPLVPLQAVTFLPDASKGLLILIHASGFNLGSGLRFGFNITAAAILTLGQERAQFLDFHFLFLRASEILLFSNLQLFYWHFLEILWLFIFLVFYKCLCLRITSKEWFESYSRLLSAQQKILTFNLFLVSILSLAIFLSFSL